MVRGREPPLLDARPKLDVRTTEGRATRRSQHGQPTNEANQSTWNFEIRVPLAAGPHEIGASFLGEDARIESGRGGNAVNSAGIEYVSIVGPYNPKRLWGYGEPAADFHLQLRSHP